AGADSCGFGITVAGVQSAAGCVAVSGTGNATNTAGDSSCGAGFGGLGATGITAGCVSASGTGNASNSGGSPARGLGETLPVAQSCGFATEEGVTFGGVPIPPLEGLGVAVGCVAGSAIAQASNTAGPDSCGATGGALAVAVGCIPPETIPALP